MSQETHERVNAVIDEIADVMAFLSPQEQIMALVGALSDVRDPQRLERFIQGFFILNRDWHAAPGDMDAEVANAIGEDLKTAKAIVDRDR
jgi:hypothetical protein